MQSIQFWKSWAKEYQRIGLMMGCLFVGALILFWHAWYISPAPALSWVNVQEQEIIQIPVHTFQYGLLEFTVQGDTYLIFDRLLGKPLQPNKTAGYIFLTALLIGMVMILTIITTLKRFWYLVGMGLFILFVVGFRLEIIQMFGFTNKLFTIGVLVLYSIPSFYFQFFNTKVTFKNRLYTFSIATVLTGLLIELFATVALPLLHLSVTGVSSGIILSIIFILMVAHEIPASFVSVVSQSSKQNKSLNHFLIISAVYMINLALAYAHKIEMIEWDFMYINFYLLISISGILGMWGFRQRRPQYESIMEADPFGVYLFWALGIICFATMGYFIGTANDSALVTINDVIIYSHLGFGIIFITYVISNFFSMLAENMPVYKVLYKPVNMPYFTFRFGGIIATLAFVFYNTWQAPVHNAFSGYYNAAGDLYQSLNSLEYAEAFYRQAGTYGFLNHHSNYAIANLEAGKNFNSVKERNYYNRANEKRPTEFSYLNYSQTYQQNRQWLESRFTLNEALKKFPDSGPIKNTLGLVYSKLNLIDSSLFFLQQAIGDEVIKNEAEANFIGVTAKNNLVINADSLFQLIASENVGIQNNALAFANVQGTKIDFSMDIEADTVLDLFSGNLISNFIINHPREVDTAFIFKAVEIAQKPTNINYRESILFASALALYADGRVGKAFTLLEEITIYSNNPDKYNTILAMWALENRAPHDAVGFIDFVLHPKEDVALPIYATALSEVGRIDEALIKWDSIRLGKDSTNHEYAENMIASLSISPAFIRTLNDEEKFLYANYRIPIEDSLQFNSAINQIENEELKARAILAKSQRWFELDEMDEAIRTFQKIKGLQLFDKPLYDQIVHFELEMLAKKGDLRSLASQINNQSMEFNGKWKSEQIYFSALLNQLTGDSITLKKQFQWLSVANPYHEDAIISAAHYFKLTNTDQLLPYAILAEALHANPFSVKLLKAYSLEAAEHQFEGFAKSALERLKPLLPPRMLRKFLSDNQNTFAQVLE